jgi:hypothetical protein
MQLRCPGQLISAGGAVVAQGLATREVAAQLFLSPCTIEFHLATSSASFRSARAQILRTSRSSGATPVIPVNPPARAGGACGQLPIDPPVALDTERKVRCQPSPGDSCQSPTPTTATW